MNGKIVRRDLRATQRVDRAKDTGFPVFRVPEDAHPITLEDVKTLDDEP